MPLKIGIAGSAFRPSKEELSIARRLGEELEKHPVHIFVCFDQGSLPVEAAKVVKVPVTCFACNEDEKKAAERQGLPAINVNLPRLSRELEFIKCIDALVVCGGGSGTLMEVTFAYQLAKPVFLLEEVESAVTPFKNTYLDKRKKVMIHSTTLNNIDENINTLLKSS